MKKLIVSTIAILALAACSSFEKDYVVIDAALDDRPDWIVSPKEVNEDDDSEKYRYFSGENENVNKKLCETGSSVDADKKLAAEISQMIKNTYAESSQSEDDNSDTYAEEALAKNVKVTVSGSQLAGMYWEKRAYSTDLGAMKDQKTFYCYAVSKIEKARLERIIDASIDKFVKSLTGNKAKEKALTALKDAEKEFVEKQQ